MSTVADLLRDLVPPGEVYIHDLRFPRSLRLQKTQFIKTVKRMKPHAEVHYAVFNPKGIGIYSRYIVLQP